MNQSTLQFQQARNRKWYFHKTPELKSFYPQGTFGEDDLTNFSIPIDPTWESAGHYDASDDYVPEGERLVDPLFGSPVNGRMLHGRWEYVKNNIERWKFEVEIVKQELADKKLNCRMELKWAKKTGWPSHVNYLKKSHEKQIRKYKAAVKRAEEQLAYWLLEAKKYDY